MNELWSWFGLFGLGAYHGINPGMGWLFAVALGMQEHSRRAVVAALPPIALGHALSVTIVVGLLWFLQANVHSTAVQWGAAVLLIGFGLSRLIRSRHPQWVGMRVGFRDLTVWSFVMASAHGAGLMLVPLLLGWSDVNSLEHVGHAMHRQAGAHAGHFSPHLTTTFTGMAGRLAAVSVHTIGHLLVAALIALVVYEKLGLALLRRLWLNLDLLWMLALILSGVCILLM
ncbi:MAG: hypothetical protein AB1671_20390 [Thermodesulfobacteriota bacterium]